MASKRITEDLQELLRNPSDHYSAGLVKDDLFTWEAKIFGPVGSPFEGGVFCLVIVFPTNYPKTPPKITFQKRVYHPKINAVGHICLDILRENWCPAFTISMVLSSIYSFLTDPNPDDAYDDEIARVYKHHREEYEKTAREWTREYAG